MKNDHTNQDDENLENDAPDINMGNTVVAKNKSQNLALLVVFAVFLMAVGYFLFIKEDPSKKPKEEIRENIKLTQVPIDDMNVKLPKPALPNLPETPKIASPDEPKPPINAPPQVIASVQPMIPMSSKNADLENSLRPGSSGIAQTLPIKVESKRDDQKMRSPMTVKGGSGSGVAVDDAGGLTGTPLDIVTDQVRVQAIGNLATTIAQGKVIDAVLETAINTDMPGTIRAVVTRDVYGEASNNVLIPKGSRLIGQYNSDIAIGQTRIQVIWGRLITPRGVSIQIKSPGIDPLGRAGMGGIVNNKYFETFSNALLVSVVNYGIAKVADKIYDNQNKQPSTSVTDPLTGAVSQTNATTTTTVINPNGSQSTSTTQPVMSNAAASLQESSKRIGDITKKMVSQQLDSKPTIYVDQGTMIKVFVMQDIVFPILSSGKYKVVQ